MLAIANHFTIILLLLYANAINTLAIFYQIIRFSYWVCVRSLYFSLHFAIDFSYIHLFICGNLVLYIRYDQNVYPKTAIILHAPRFAKH